MFRILLDDFIGDLKVQRTRALLTFLAVTWGTLAVVLLLAFGEGLKRTVRDGLLGAGERIFMIYGGETSKTFAGLPQGRRIRLVEEDLWWAVQTVLAQSAFLTKLSTDRQEQLDQFNLTAHALASDRQKSVEVGCADFDTKPVDLPRLLSKINACLGA